MNKSAYRAQRTTLAAVLCAFALLIPNLASAAGWSIDPVRVLLSPSRQTTVITITNDGDQPTSIQIQPVAWSQVDGKDIYTPTHELLVAPPIVTIAPKSEQVIRVALRKPADMTNELAYRINLQELPVAPAPNLSTVQVAMRIGLPVFVQSQKGDAAPKLVWSVVRMPNNMLKVGLRNEGTAHVQISNFSLYATGEAQAIASEVGSVYLLAGQSRAWLLKAPALEKVRGDRLRLKADTDGDDIDSEIALGR
jgi:fimbrial chaperone protein